MKRALMHGQKTLFDEVGKIKNTTLTSTFQDNLSLPIHRWFRYSAGFSALWVRKLLEHEKLHGRHRLLDPFAGSGTTLLEGEQCGFEAIGIEAHPFVSRIAQAKLCWRADAAEFLDYGTSILESARSLSLGEIRHADLIRKCFNPKSLARLDSLLAAWRDIADSSALSELAWLAFVSIIRACSPVGTAQWQYILPKKTKAKVLDPFEAFEAKIRLISEDMTKRQNQEYGPKALLYRDDARECSCIERNWADLIITSPPYANNYDYADATRLEMSLLGEVNNWGDLQESVRKYLIRSCTQHVASINKNTEEILKEKRLSPIRNEIQQVCERLGNERHNHGGKKPYHTMIAAYFSDMARVWVALRRVTAKHSLICFVVGDSAPYGVYVPVEKWLGELAVAAGFESYAFEKIRNRNIKWKNRKHRVPLHEGRLWVHG